MAAAEIDVGKMSEVADNKKKITVQWILLPSLLLPLSRPADVGLASRAVIPSGHYPRIKEEICMTIGGSARPTLTSRDDGLGKMMGAMKAARASEPHPETHSRILVAGTCLSFSILGETSERSCPEEADSGGRRDNIPNHYSPSCRTYLFYVAAAAAAAWRWKKRMKTTAAVGSGRRKKSGGSDNVVQKKCGCKLVVGGGVCVCTKKDIFWSSVK